MTDDDPPDEMPVTKHGIKVTYVPPHLRPVGPHKSSVPIVDNNKKSCLPAKSVVKD
jgi:hypothetical protein